MSTTNITKCYTAKIKVVYFLGWSFHRACTRHTCNSTVMDLYMFLSVYARLNHSRPVNCFVAVIAGSIWKKTLRIPLICSILVSRAVRCRYVSPLRWPMLLRSSFDSSRTDWCLPSVRSFAHSWLDKVPDQPRRSQRRESIGCGNLDNMHGK